MNGRSLQQQRGEQSGKSNCFTCGWRRWLVLVLVPAGLLLGTALLLLSDPLGGRGPMPCLLHQLTGLYCIGCGTSRALRSLLGLQIKAALSYNLFMLLWLPLPAYALAGLWLQALRQKVILPPVHDRRWLLLLLLVSALLFLVFRNLPWPLFHWLAP